MTQLLSNRRLQPSLLALSALALGASTPAVEEPVKGFDNRREMPRFDEMSPEALAIRDELREKRRLRNLRKMRHH